MACFRALRQLCNPATAAKAHTDARPVRRGRRTESHPSNFGIIASLAQAHTRMSPSRASSSAGSPCTPDGRPRQAADDGHIAVLIHSVANLERDAAHGLKVVGGRHRKASLNDVNPQLCQLPRNVQLLLAGQRRAWRLLAIPQRGVEYAHVTGPDRILSELVVVCLLIQTLAERFLHMRLPVAKSRQKK